MIRAVTLLETVIESFGTIVWVGSRLFFVQGKGPKYFKCELYEHIATRCNGNKREIVSKQTNYVSSACELVKLKISDYEPKSMVDTRRETEDDGIEDVEAMRETEDDKFDDIEEMRETVEDRVENMEVLRETEDD
ncbi:hypothetical protein O3M35_007579 [Rhynocoris fuscipes]|uniref:Uncharacterized protein n=1 Tax=Rhynocoris fuscipes TaxID=488301 RepID=A0AAW1DDJ9_9HEMI